MEPQADRVRVRHQRARGSVALLDHVLVGADAVSIRRDRLQARRRCHGSIAWRGPVGGSAVSVHQLDQAQARHRVQPLEIVDFERLDEHRVTGLAPPRRLQLRDQPGLHRMADAGEIARMLGLGINADHPPAFAVLLGECDHFGKRRHFELPVIFGIVGPQLRQAFDRAQRLQFGEREILGEPADMVFAIDHLLGLARGEFGMAGDIGGAGDVILVAAYEHIVLGQHQIGFDEVRTLFDRQRIRRDRVFGPQPARAAMRDHNWGSKRL